MNVHFFHFNVDNTKSIHPVYAEIMNNPPEGVIYTNKDAYLGTDNTKIVERSRIQNALLAGARKLKKGIGLPNILPVRTDADVIHAAGILVESNRPWVVDMEIIAALSTFDPVLLKKPLSRYLIRRSFSGKKCRAILPWSNAAKESILTLFDMPGIREKIRVISPAMHVPNVEKEESDTVRFLYVSRFFARKGGFEVVDAFLRIADDYPDARLMLISDIPDEVPDHPQIEKAGLMQRERVLAEGYARSDVFVYPTFYDTFGMVLLEAMGYSLPCITLDDYATKEIVDDCKDGFVIEGYPIRQIGPDGIHIKRLQDPDLLMELNKDHRDRVVKDIAEKMRILMDVKTRERFGKNAYEKVAHGKFSIDERNKRLLEAYRS